MQGDEHNGATGPIYRHRDLAIESFPRGEVSRLYIDLVANGLAQDILLPLLIARGKRDGPVFGLTAAVHGNELNGIRVIHDLIHNLDIRQLSGTVVAVAVVNVPGLYRHQREFVDGSDLNHLFPGRPDGDVARVYAHRIIDRIVNRFDYLVDLHTASFGRVNSLYVRADMTHAATATMAYLQRPQIIVHNPPTDPRIEARSISRRSEDSLPEQSMAMRTPSVPVAASTSSRKSGRLGSNVSAAPRWTSAFLRSPWRSATHRNSSRLMFDRRGSVSGPCLPQRACFPGDRSPRVRSRWCATTRAGCTPTGVGFSKYSRGPPNW